MGKTIKYLLLSLLIVISPLASFSKERITYKDKEFTMGVTYVQDGDTIVLKNKEHVRIVGIDTPEKNEPYYRKAKKRMKKLVHKKEVSVKICPYEERDKYDRLLAFIYIGGQDVGEIMLKEGLARTLSIPPCGNINKKAYKKFEKEAKEKGLNIWKKKLW